MKAVSRLLIAASLVLVYLLVKFYLDDIWNSTAQAPVSPHPNVTVANESEETPVIPSPAKTFETQTHGSNEQQSSPGETMDGVIVMAKLQEDNTNWVEENLPSWKHAIYTVDNTSAPLHTPMNKGKEAMAYLTYIIDNYLKLPKTIVFLHSHRDGYPQSWHTDAPDYDNVNSVRNLKLDFVQRNGYVNLRCIWTPGCPNEIQPFREGYEEQRKSEHATEEAWRYMFNSTEVPHTIGVTCCSQFAVSRDQVLARPLENYLRYRQWLFDTELADAVSGRVFEYFWHIIFGKDPVYCPETEVCYCEVYGNC